MSTVVLAEANASTRKRLTRILLTDKYTVKQLEPAQDAVWKLKAQRPSLLVFDLTARAKRGFGFEILEQILRGAPDFPVLVLTPRTPSGVFQKVRALGATELIFKPFDDAEFQYRVENLLMRTLDLVQTPLPLVVSKPYPPLNIQLQGLHDPASGRINAAYIAEYLGVPLSELAKALGSNYTAVHKTPAASSLQKQLTPIKQSLAILSELIGDPATVRAWLNSPHPDLGKRKPIDVILEGRAEALLTILENARDGVPS